MLTGIAYVTYSIADKAAVLVSAEEQKTSDGWSYEVKDDGTAKIVGYSKEGGDLIIPNTVDRKKVTEIGDYSFKNKKGYQSVTVPETVEVIGRNAFQGCTGLRSIDIKSGVETIRSGAFDSCTGLRNVTIQNGVETIEAVSGVISLADVRDVTARTLVVTVVVVGKLNFNEVGLSSVVGYPLRVEGQLQILIAGLIRHETFL